MFPSSRKRDSQKPQSLTQRNKSKSGVLSMSPGQKSSTPIVNVGPDVELKNAKPTITPEDKTNYGIITSELQECVSGERGNAFKAQLSRHKALMQRVIDIIDQTAPEVREGDRFQNAYAKILDRIKISKESIDTENENYFKDCVYLHKKLKEMEENPENKLYFDKIKQIVAARATRSKHGGGGVVSRFLKSNKSKKPVTKTEELSAEELAELEKRIQEDEAIAELEKIIQEDEARAAALADAERIQSLMSRPLPGSVEQEELELAELEKPANNGGTRKRRKYKKHKKHKKHKKTLTKKY
jgi:hypothetical protein